MHDIKQRGKTYVCITCGIQMKNVVQVLEHVHPEVKEGDDSGVQS